MTLLYCSRIWGSLATKKNYFDNEKVRAAVEHFQKTGDISKINECEKMITQLIKAVINYYKIYRFADYNDLIQESWILIIKSLPRVDVSETKGSVFNYFSFVVKQGLKNKTTTWTRRANKHSELKESVYEDESNKSGGDAQDILDFFDLPIGLSEKETKYIETLKEAVKAGINDRGDFKQFMIDRGFEKSDIRKANEFFKTSFKE